MKYTLYIQTSNDLLIEKYSKAIEDMKNSTNVHKDSGFDLYFPELFESQFNSTSLADLQVRCAAYCGQNPTGFYLYPRSSIYKTNFRLANNVGIIDSGYRGNLKVALDCRQCHRDNDSTKILPGTRLFQICMPTLEPFEVKLVRELNTTERGEGGHGSTGT
jgi:dUTP pyrophosphatase